ncbi:MAG: phosphoglucosamine mutase [Methanomicrobiales archaeon]|nr:phosphoglucosamine mutase [Methanomicrobiales archaeon]
MKFKRLFGTNGVRGIVGKEMTPALAMKIGAALATMRKGTIVVGRDTRTSGQALGSALKAGIMGGGCSVIDAGILPTPALQYIVRDRYAAGAMVTASHNPPEYNGIKIVEPDGTEMGDMETIELESILYKGEEELARWDCAGTEYPAPQLVNDYIKGVLSHFPPGLGEGMTVVVDSGSGAGAFCTPAILSAMGCRVLTINGEMNGRFPGRMPEPSPEGLRDLVEFVKSSGATFGVAHDGDADRSVFIDERGRYIEENREFALMVRMMCRRRRGMVVAPVSTSLVVEEVANNEGTGMDYTPVGSIYVARRMKELIASGISVAMGGEGNGGLIYPFHQFCRDGAMTAAMMVQLLSEEQKPLSSLSDALPSYYMIKDKIETAKGEEVIRALGKEYQNEKMIRIDGVKIIRDGAWALIRPSGTEPLVRLVVESRSEKDAIDLHRELRGLIARSVKK